MKFSTPVFQEIFDIYLEAYQSEDPVVPSHKKFINHSNPEIQKLVVDTLASPYELSANWEKHNIFTTKN